MTRTLRELREMVRANHVALGYLEDLWECLTATQQDELITVAETMVERNGIAADDMPEPYEGRRL